MAAVIDLNADLGEGYDYDEALMPLISSVNVACGGHAGDVDTMRRTVRLAKQHGVAIGAHPSYPDRQHFGRVSLDLSPMLLVEVLTSQLWALNAVCIEEGVSIAYVKPHGALYNDAARNPALAQLLAETIREIDPELALMGMAGSVLLTAASAAGLRPVAEAFVDRAYQANGQLVPRSHPNAVHDDAATAVGQACDLVLKGGLRAENGSWLAIAAQSLCLHGDTPLAHRLAERVRTEFAAREITVAPAWLLA
ncbi:MAG TPA: 5-oxoprolinase subunit PxpA [Chitinolyticbacter sp.]|nr:5-oxoprolinase subunit PxpA [Chitinolyticbacter sp.]